MEKYFGENVPKLGFGLMRLPKKRGGKIDTRQTKQMVDMFMDAEFVQLQLNYADWENPQVTARENYEVARKHGKSIIVMEPVKGGALADPPKEVGKIFKETSPDASFASWAIRGCIACNSCRKNGKCVFDDLVNEAAPKFEACDGLVIASPVYYASANGTLISFIDRLFYSVPFDKTMKVGACVVTARRGGLSATFDELNKYFTISGMPEKEPFQRTNFIR